MWGYGGSLTGKRAPAFPSPAYRLVFNDDQPSDSQLYSCTLYPPPLQLNLEPPGQQEFLETAVTGGDKISLQMLMKRYTDIVAKRDHYRVRFSKLASRRTNRNLATGIITRAVQYTTPVQTLKLTLQQLQVEMLRDGIAKGVYCEAVACVLNSKVCKKQDKVKKILKHNKAWW